MSEDTRVYMIEVTLTYGHCIRMQFTAKGEADDARKAISAAMAKGKYQSDDVVNIVSETCTYDIRASEVLSVSVVDTKGWNEIYVKIKDHADSLGLPQEANT